LARIGFISLGCPKNLVDSEVMIGLLEREGHAIIPDAERAEILIINTCSFIGDARRESIDAVLAAGELKKSGSLRRLIVTGCLPERYAREILMELPEIDAILGVNQIPLIARAVRGEARPPPDSFGRRDADLYLYDHTTPRTLSGPPHAAYMKVSEGCDHRCAFCVIPRIRGRFRSRSLPSLVSEAEQLAARGVREITLVSQDTTAYGSDLGMKDGLARLLRELGRVEAIGWIRFLYIHPDRVSRELIEAVNSSPRICRYIDMPLQHASGAVLRAMRRGGNRSTFTRIIERLRRGIPGVTLRTTLIVGFPGETRADFLELKDFCREMEFDRLGVFTYSDEEDTIACGLEPKVSRRTAERRRRILMEQQAEISRRKNRELVGRRLEVLVEGPAEESDLLLEGRLRSQAPGIDGVCLINDSEAGEVRAGQFRTLRITRALEHDLLGTIVA
jgi:ribosomal protein S12 methylthiotransferase